MTFLISNELFMVVSKRSKLFGDDPCCSDCCTILFNFFHFCCCNGAIVAPLPSHASFRVVMTCHDDPRLGLR